MKKTMIVLIALFLAIPAFTQETITPAGKFTIDLNFDPAAIFDAAAGSMFYMPYIKGRYFIASDAALRLGFLLNMESDKEYQDADGNDYEKSSSKEITIAPGYEKLFGSNRFYFYVGGELPIGLYSTKTVTEIGGNKVEAKNPNGGYFSLGLDLILGADFYVLPNLYIGAELSPGFYFVKYSDTEVDGTVTQKGGSGSGFDISSGSGIRLGVRF